ncbi:hypothetical protein X777_07404 [Ooceraea biroi]|uniref:Uncharacterized protein n=1 Tax=Ooceraea biroi TaxID=2015173 RepID=A0A026WD12_OOCBI|nr:hypothetical protein X777_07404 [Ooceraea biroi]
MHTRDESYRNLRNQDVRAYEDDACRTNSKPRHHEGFMFRASAGLPAPVIVTPLIWRIQNQVVDERVATARAPPCQERVTDMSLTASDYRRRPTPTAEDSGRRGKEGAADQPVPDQFTFTFRVEDDCY